MDVLPELYAVICKAVYRPDTHTHWLYGWRASLVHAPIHEYIQPFRHTDINQTHTHAGIYTHTHMQSRIPGDIHNKPYRQTGRPIEACRQKRIQAEKYKHTGRLSG